MEYREFDRSDLRSVPAVQNVDKRKYRPLLVAAPGCVLLKADYKQLQMRLLANMSHDPELIKVFRKARRALAHRGDVRY